MKPSNMALTFPGKKLQSNQMASHAWRVTVEIEPDELPQAFINAAPGSEWVFVVCRKGEEGEALPPEQPEDKAKRQGFDTMPRVRQAGILCKEKDFQEFLAKEDNSTVLTEDEAKHVLYKWFKIDSRTKLNDINHVQSWARVMGQFSQWKTDRQYGDHMR